MLQDIIRYLETAENASSPIADSQVRSWMSSNDPEVLGATYVTFKYDPFGRRIEKISPTMTSIFAYDAVNLVETVNG